MGKRLIGYLVLSLFSFCSFTAFFHSVAHAQTVAFASPPLTQETLTYIPGRIRLQQVLPLSPSPTALPTQLPTQPPQPIETPPLPTHSASSGSTTTNSESTTNNRETTATPQPTIPVVLDLETLFTKYSDEYHIDRELLKRIARCESGFNSQADTGTYVGMFQFAVQSWISTRNAMGLDTNPDLRKHAEESIRTASFMLARGQQNAWPNCH